MSEDVHNEDRRDNVMAFLCSECEEAFDVSIDIGLAMIRELEDDDVGYGQLVCSDCSGEQVTGP